MDKMEQQDEASDQQIRKIKKDTEEIIEEHKSRERQAKESAERIEKQKNALMKNKQEEIKKKLQ